MANFSRALHTGGVRPHRQVDELLQLGELHDLVAQRSDLALLEAQRQSAEDDVALAGQVGDQRGADAPSRFGRELA